MVRNSIDKEKHQHSRLKRTSKGQIGFLGKWTLREFRERQAMRQVNKVAAKIQNRFKGMMVQAEKNRQQAEKERYHSGQVFHTTLQEYTSVVL